MAGNLGYYKSNCECNLVDYTYLPLRNSTQQIRLVELLPAAENDSIRVMIHHTDLPLLTAPQNPLPRASFEQVEETLPPRWSLRQNPLGQYIFENQDTGKLQWEHPKPDVDHSTYKLPPSPKEDFEPKYEALSYTWGSNHKLQHIIVEHARPALATDNQFYSAEDPETLRQITAFKLAVTDNVVEALRYMRYQTRSRLLWIDSICIQQSDDVEKSQQVSFMPVIYRQAYRVVVWLGPEANGSNHAIQALQYIGNQSEVDAHSASWIPSPDAVEFEWADTTVKLPYDEDTWKAVLALLRRRWFTRLWVVQEIHLANTRPGAIIQCGFDFMEYVDLKRAICCLEHRILPSEAVKQVVAHAWRLLRLTRDGIFRLVLRTVMVGRDCEDPRDKVYGMLGLAPRQLASKIRPDYSATVMAADAFRTTVLAHARQVERLELFDLCSLLGRNIGGPSWVPDWTTSHRNGSPWFLGSQFATGASRAHFNYDNSKPYTLEVLGIQCAVVSRVSEPLRSEPNSWDAVLHVRRWQPQHLDLDTALYEPTGEPLRSAYGLTLINNRIKERWPQYDFLPSQDHWLKQDRNDALFGSHANLEFDEQRESRTRERVSTGIQYALRFCQDRLFASTHEGYFGLAPADTKSGDIVALFLGCPNPIIIRHKGGISSYQIVGECWIYGLHDVIKLLGPIPSPYRARAFYTSDGRENYGFVNSDSGELDKEDPRLEPLSSTTWRRIHQDVDGDCPMHYDFFQQQETGQVTNYDPRLEPEILRERGIHLNLFSLI
ncbi:heterokaryon incompatibility protein-domain-containing protein [Hypoxylon trugodes]|uniref:heterokaryon incompatibility protein-domain-containing protein n=1 Tax=Hypoxylon trugodes TaxID=326681 RepID=UPI00219CF214|nr:heterokaryon incompatibility protein-domain-containing protein [Hypoxylon trugodes]KAI1387626.1 heterokaryon incompatibility protein-domain-containing protein [Hypoxylon trugodes]